MADDLGRRVKALRKTQGKSLRDLASRTGLSATHLSEIERGRSSPTVYALVRIAKALHRSPSELLQEAPGACGALTRASERRIVTRGKDGFSVWALGELPRGTQLEAFLVEVPNAAAQRASVLEGSRLVCLYSLSGKTDVEIDGRQTATLGEGASLQTLVTSTCSFKGEGGKVLAVVARETPIS